GFEVIATAVGPQTVVGQIGQLLHQAMWQRAPVERQADRLAAWLVPLAVTLALATFAFWTWQDSMETGLIHALAVLLIACPCALGIATPLTLWVGLGRATRSGVILRYTGVLEQLAEAGQIYFDKTGTLTKRPIRLQEVVVDSMAEADFLARAAAVEAMSEHPLGQAIAAGAEKWLGKGVLPPRADNFRAFPGQGVCGVVAGDEVWIGNRRLMAQHGLEIPGSLADTAVFWQNNGLTVAYAGWGGHARGLLGLGETARAEAGESIADLQKLEMPVTILTGDSEVAGRRWQSALGVPVYAEQRPEDKVSRLQAAGKDTVMVGDGINDGPALAAASVGIAVRQGTDVAQSAAAVILLHDDLRAVPWLIALSRVAMRKVRQNLAWAIGYNALGLVLAVSGLLQPSLAALLMVFSNIIVTTNALRLRQANLGDLSFAEIEEVEETEEEENMEDRRLEIGDYAQSPIANL
ncbi:MAG TPA: cation-translocating P-type ATPase, partial [Anaerolineae bacterium]|nr:cation-translocating P-type ATPase [Anaerolineae bacterium]